MLSPTIFLEREICGIAETDLLDEDVVTLGKALASYLIRYSGRNFCLGRDLRDSSVRIHGALLKGLVSAGAHVSDLGIVPAPVLFSSVFDRPADAGIMITGGDHSPGYNGFKVVCGTSLLFGRALEDVYKMAISADFESEEGEVKPAADGCRTYVDQVASQFTLPRAVQLHIDAGSEMTKPVLDQLLTRLKASSVKKNQAEASAVISPGSDRLEVADEKGNPIAPEFLLLLFGREILTRKPGSTFLYDECFPDSISRRLIELGGRAVPMSATEPSIQARLKQEHAELGVLASGEIVFADRYYGFADGIYATCRLLEIIAPAQKALSLEVAEVKESAAPAA